MVTFATIFFINFKEKRNPLKFRNDLTLSSLVPKNTLTISPCVCVCVFVCLFVFVIVVVVFVLEITYLTHTHTHTQEQHGTTVRLFLSTLAFLSVLKRHFHWR